MGNVSVSFDGTEERYGLQDAAFLRSKLQEAEVVADDPREVDMERVCDILNKEEVDEYEEVCSDGCCGSHDEVVTAPSGRKYRIGFNYGH